jgi:DMSO/TMAO reductase YedYZ molybdopterin-dependent catalytic subunit
MFSILLAAAFLGQVSAGPTVKVEPLAFDPAKLADRDKVELKVKNGDRLEVYSGVPLASLLPGKPDAGMAGLRNLSDAVILVRGTDGYQAAVSAAAVAMDPKGERFLLATARDGKPLAESEGPARLVVPGDPKHVRWVKNIASIRLVRLEEK